MTNTAKKYHVITVSGIGEPSRTDRKVLGMLKGLTDKLPVEWTKEQFNWQDYYGPIGGEWDSKEYSGNITAAIRDLVHHILLYTTNGIGTPVHPIILMGYSGGAHVASLAAEQIKNDIAGLVLVANPLRRKGEGGLGERYGVAGQHGAFGDKVSVFNVSNPKDVIPYCDQISPVRDFYALSKEFSLVDMRKWGLSLLQYLTEVLTGMHTPTRPYHLGEILLAMNQVNGYLWYGEHTDWYASKMEKLAEDIVSNMP